MIYLLYTIHLLVCLFLIMVVLLQQGKGADLSVFGGGSTQTAFGARGAATLLHKLTVVSFILFIVTTMSIALVKSTPGGGSSVMSDVMKEQAKEEDVPGATAPEATETAAPAAAEVPASTPGDSAPEQGAEPAPETPSPTP